MMDNRQHYQYRVGGPLREDDPCYVERQADKDLYKALKAAEYCYVLNSRQMGKSSLVVRARKKLEIEGFAVAYVDLTLLGTENVSLDQWYTTLLSNLADSFELGVDPISWWQTYSSLVPLARLSKFIETFLLTKDSTQHYVIVVDEIDTVLSLKEFCADDFFAFIRGCYIQQTHKPEYQRLCFVLIGVATPSDLIADRDRTPFNLGQAIALHGFEPSEVSPLAKGLESCAIADPPAVLKAILEWTGGQPFLTQKLCQLIQETQLAIPAEHEAERVEDLVRSRIIKNWEENDKPQHLGTIRDRIIRNMMLNNIMNIKDERHASNLLSLYQKILQYGKISADNSPEQEDLRLSGLVVKRDGTLRVYNRIYQEVFNQQWVQKELAKLRPYREQITAWSNSNYTDESRLLHGKALQDALIWAEQKQLDPEDRKFLDTSRTFEQIAQAVPEVGNILRKYLPQLQGITDSLAVTIQEIQAWGRSQAFLIEQVCKLLIEANTSATVPDHQEAKQVEQLVQRHLIQDWENGRIREHLTKLQSRILEDENRLELLQLYRQVLDQELQIASQGSQVRTLIDLGLVSDRQGNLEVSNRIYENVFNRAWIEQELAKKRQIIGERYEIIKELNRKDAIHTFLAKDQHRSKQYVIKQLIPAANDSDTLEETKRLISRKLRDFGKIDASIIPDLDPYFEEDRLYLIQEYIDGHNLDENKECSLGQRLGESQVINLLINILETLVPIHEQGIAHGNLKPSNLRRQHQGKQHQPEKIIPIDFGFLKEIVVLIANSGQSIQPQQIGTIGYIPPEDTGDWSEFHCDIYAVGVIGIQALTGLEPKHLPRDQRTGELIWRFATPDQPMIGVSSELARILTKMIRHSPKERYSNASEVYQDLKKLQAKKRSLLSWFVDRRVLTASISLLLLTNIFSIWWHQRYIENQKSTQQASVNNIELDEQIKQCNHSIEATQNIRNSLVTVDMVANARRIVDACNQATQNPLTSINKGKALLLLSLSSLQLNQKQDSQSYLNDAKNSFLEARTANDSNPQPHFYLGVITQLQGGNTAQRDYDAAIARYLKSESKAQEDDYFILVSLASIAESLNRIDDATNLYEKAVNVKPDAISDRQLANLRYNQAILSDKGDGTAYSSARTRKFLNQATEVEANHQLTDDYSNKCLGKAETQEPSRCTQLRSPLPVYACQHYPVLAIAQFDKTLQKFRFKSLCE